MKTREEKRNNSKTFIHNQVGDDNFRALFLFRLTSLNLIDTIIINGIFFEKLDEILKDENLGEDNKIRIKQQMILDNMMKIEIIIESFLVLIDSLSKGYKTIAERMTGYENSFIKFVINNINNNIYDLKKVLGLPIPSSLTLLNKEEIEFLHSDFLYGEEQFKIKITKLINFYQKFKLVYLKSKHGLTLQLGQFNSGSTKELENSSMICYDIKKEKDMPPGYITSKIENYTFDRSFTAISILTFKKELINEINEILGILKQFVDLIYQNHYTHITNLGIEYVPYIKVNDKVGLLNFKNYRETEMMEDSIRIIKNIINKTFPNMNFQDDVKVEITTNYTKKEIIDSIINNTITNIFSPNK